MIGGNGFKIIAMGLYLLSRFVRVENHSPKISSNFSKIEPGSSVGIIIIIFTS